MTDKKPKNVFKQNLCKYLIINKYGYYKLLVEDDDQIDCFLAQVGGC